MKKTVLYMLLLVMLMVCSAGWAEHAPDMGEVMLYTAYRQMGWGDRIQLGWMDDDGNLWTLSGHDSELHWPYDAQEQVAFLEARRDAQWGGRLDYDRRFALKTLIESVEEQPLEILPAACDAGTEKSCAVRRDRSGKVQVIVLGMSGDDLYENTSPDAQALYLSLRQLFPGVISYGDGMGPAGFQPLPVRTFCAWPACPAENLLVSGGYTDCESGWWPVEMTEEEQEWVRTLYEKGMVLGKANAMDVTGGIRDYRVTDAQGNTLFSFSMYEGLLMRPDGMYRISVP